ncbi:galactokinase [Alkalispirochaeta sphaeroplastigenens]|nr:galactokinase family protein [Alkalispirochaeta sphaeroplastigenens]
MILPIPEMLSHVTDGPRRVAELQRRYRRTYGADPTVVVSAPGRTEIIGNHTDHNNGRVVAAAITQDTLVVAGPARAPRESTLRLLSLGWDREFSLDLARPDEASHDTERLMLGVAEGLAQRDLPAPPYWGCMESRVLPGSGLSSSAALEVALAGVHAVLAGVNISPLEAALAGKYAENTHMNKPSGLMDQLASALGGMNAIDFIEPREPRIHRMDVDFSRTNHTLVVVHTGGSHADLTDDYASIPREMGAVARGLGAETLSGSSRKQLLAHLSSLRSQAGDRAILRALHFFDEQDRVLAFADAADSRKTTEILQIMNESGDSSARLLQNITTEGASRDQSLALGLALTRSYLEHRQATGACRVHGGGFAGTMLAVIPDDLLPEYTRALERAFGEGSVVPLEIRPQGLVAAHLEGAEELLP